MGRFGSTLKRFRENKGLSKVKLAKNIGTSDAYIRQVENQGYKPPTFELCEKIAGELTLNNEEKLALYEAAFIERIESEKQFYNLLKSSIFSNNTEAPTQQLVTFNVRKNIFESFNSIKDKIYEIIVESTEKFKLDVSNIVIFDTSIQFDIVSLTPETEKQIESVMKDSSSKIKNSFPNYGDTPSIWEKSFKSSANKSPILDTVDVRETILNR